MTRPVQDIELNDRGQETHPAFVRISAGQVSHGGGGAVLFDSDITHQHTVRIRIETASRERRHHHDSIFGVKEIIEVELSQAQWASFVSSMNSTGTAATLRWDHGQVPELPYAPRMAMQMNEVRDAAKDQFAEIKRAMDEYEAAIESKAGARVIKQKRFHLRAMMDNAPKNVVFSAKSLTEYTEGVVQGARADIEAMVLNKAQQLGLDPAHATQVLALPVSTEPAGPATHDVQQPDTWTAECFTGNHQACSGHAGGEDDPGLCECPHHDDEARDYTEAQL